MVDFRIRPFLMFEGKAEEAMNFYVSLFPGAKVIDIERYGPNRSGAERLCSKSDFFHRKPDRPVHGQHCEAHVYFHSCILFPSSIGRLKGRLTRFTRPWPRAARN